MIGVRKKSGKCIFSAQHRFIPWSVGTKIDRRVQPRSAGSCLIWPPLVSTSPKQKRKNEEREVTAVEKKNS